MGEAERPDMKTMADMMRAAGVRRARFLDGTELELFDTIPAPPPEDLSLPPTEHAELKSDSQCVATGCAEQGGWYGTRYCRAHGFAAAGVK